MKLLVQRVVSAAVSIDGEITGQIGYGLVIFICAEKGDDEETASYLAAKVGRMRLFADDQGKTNLSIADIGGEALVVSQFTLAAEWKKGNRPGFSRAAAPDAAKDLYEHFCRALSGENIPVRTGRFAAQMEVSLVNDGPFTIWMDSNNPG